MMAERSEGYRKIYAAVRRVPPGRVATYGQIAELAGLPGHARQVGYALHALRDRDDEVPWHRVINSQGKISFPADSENWTKQAALLRAEGVEIEEDGRIQLARYRWIPA